jgi:hypothetical protein
VIIFQVVVEKVHVNFARTLWVTDDAGSGSSDSSVGLRFPDLSKTLPNLKFWDGGQSFIYIGLS